MKTFQAATLVAIFLILAFSSFPQADAQYYVAATWPYYYYPYTYGYGYGLYGKREAGFEPQQQQFHPRDLGQFHPQQHQQ